MFEDSIMSTTLPEFGFLRLRQIVGDRKAGIPPIFPVSASTWWSGCARNIYPKPVKHGGTTLWRLSDIRELCERISSEKEGT